MHGLAGCRSIARYARQVKTRMFITATRLDEQAYTLTAHDQLVQDSGWRVPGWELEG